LIGELILPSFGHLDFFKF